MVTHRVGSAEDLADSLLAHVHAAAEAYYRLVVLVGPRRSGKVRVLRRVAERSGGRLLNLNLELSRRLLDLELTTEQRALRLPRVLDDLLGEHGSPVLLYHIELLFDPAFQQDTLRLVKHLSRRRTIVCAWNGEVEGGFLIYGERGHHEYQRHETGELTLVEATSRKPDHLH